MSPAADSVIQRLDSARQKWWFFSLLTTAVLAVCASFGVLLLFLLVDALLKLPQIVLVGFFFVWLLATLAILFGVGRRLLRGQRSVEAAARRVEVEFPELGSNLINLVQLSEDRKNVDRTFCDAAVNQAAAQIGTMAFDRAANQESRWRRFCYCMQTPRDFVESLGALVLLIGFAIVFNTLLPTWSSAVSRLFAPWEFVPSVGSVEIVSVTPGNTDVLVGAGLDIAAEVKNPTTKSLRAVAFLKPEGEAESQVVMSADEKQLHYKAAIPAVLKPFHYRLEIGDSQTAVFAVGVREAPVIEKVDVTFHYPAYLSRKSDTFSQKGLDIEAPQYTVAELRLRTSVPIASGYLESEGGRIAGRVEDDGNLLVASLPMLKNGSYTVRLFNDAGHSDPNPRPNQITVIADQPPTVELLKPARQSSAAPGSDVSALIRASDDHGIGRLRLEMKVETAEAAPADQAQAAASDEPASIVKEWADFSGDSTSTANRSESLELKPDLLKEGQSVLIRAVVWDKRLISESGIDLKPQEVAGAWHSIKLVAEEAKSSAALEQLESLRGAIWKILEKQVHARTVAGEMVKAASLADRTGGAAAVHAEQVDIQKSSASLVESIAASDHEERVAIKRVLNTLAFNDMLSAVTLSDGLGKVKAAAEFDKPAAELITAQDHVIDVLRKLLDIARQAQTATLAEMKKRPGADLPTDTKNKLEEMRTKLEKFAEQQKKVIEATENLAKTPVEDFTEKQEEALKGMAATEDEWSKFMKEMHSDLSKLPEQDLANSSMAKELSEIQTQLKMAEDALLKKTADIAVPMEQLGAEMAEELKSNIEKWLPDSPDREKWGQEESITDKEKEAPLAELPGELEDMMGDLMEQEEDVMDEMEDASSSAIDSVDKGQGWDATDGPISDMSAKGVTGNRLPNTSEIGGRSGEGRQGKSSGEFVGDEAVGKGGRKTPSRLTPDPFVKGQIKDHSKESAGGATGGGKESGKGGEGLEGGGGRNPGKRDTERLASKQAALRNKAEAIDAKFQIANFHRTDLKKMIEIMSQIERDLKAGRYQNAIRQRQVLANGLGNVKQYLQGEFQVRQDATANLPSDIQKEILGSMQDPSPNGWEELNRQYFERLSSGNSEPVGNQPTK